MSVTSSSTSHHYICRCHSNRNCRNSSHSAGCSRRCPSPDHSPARRVGYSCNTSYSFAFGRNSAPAFGTSSSCCSCCSCCSSWLRHRQTRSVPGVMRPHHPRPHQLGDASTHRTGVRPCVSPLWSHHHALRCRTSPRSVGEGCGGLDVVANRTWCGSRARSARPVMTGARKHEPGLTAGHVREGGGGRTGRGWRPVYIVHRSYRV